MTEIKTGGIPKIEEIILESSKEQWLLFRQGVMRYFSTKGVVTVDRQSNKKVRVTITFIKVFTPNEMRKETITTLENRTPMNDAQFSSFEKIENFFIYQADRSTCLFIGYIEGKRNVPVTVMHYEKFNYSVYSIIEDKNDMNKFFPQGIPEKVHLN